MDTKRRPRRQRQVNRQVWLDEDEDDLLQQLAAPTGLRVTQYMRVLIRQTAQACGIESRRTQYPGTT